MDDKENERDAADPATRREPGLPSSSPGYSFLVHSHTSTGDSLALKHEGGLYSKCKRRRTSPQDHAILESAYQQNSKPDKNERADIVGRVQLGEKEVQIWFQNRRQNDRRRSKPLQPHELLAHIRNNLSSGVAPMNTAVPGDIEETQRNPPTPPLPSPDDPTRPASRASSIRDLLNPISPVEAAHSDLATLSTSPQANDLSTPPSSLKNTLSASDLDPQKQQSQADISDGDNSVPDSGGRKRGHQQMLDEKQAPLSTSTPPTDSVPKAAKDPLTRSSSVRLAMTIDGAVKIRTNNEPTPSPPKQRAAPPPPPRSPAQTKSGLTRSKSAFDSLGMFKDVDLSRSTMKIGAGFGRSRDARTWEFYCDSSAKDALSTQVEAERNGSAVGAINLIRSNSTKARQHVLSPAPVRVNAHPGPTRSKTGKPKLSRARSSLARLQSSETDRSTGKPGGRPSHHVRSTSGDSDKENWAPGTRTADNPLRRTQQSTNRRPILRDRNGSVSPENGTCSLTSGAGNARGEDLDCIQGLLSLSQGAWK